MAEATMKDKIVLVTGATNGIGKAAALGLAKLGATVVIAGRDHARTGAVLHEIKAKTGNESVDMLVGDLSSIAEVRRVADEFKRKYTRLHVLVNNAGGYFAQRQETIDGFEMTFGLNHLNYFLLTHLLLDTLKASAPARIINVSSDAHHRLQVNFDDLHSRQSYPMGGFQAYGQSKLCNVLFTYELARRLGEGGVTVNAMHPGAVRTGFGHNNRGIWKALILLFQFFSLTPEQGADTVIYMAAAPEIEGVSGKYFTKRQAVQSSDASYDEAAARRLWDISEELTGLRVRATV
jgi:NAD(P)-dependent dehydrogenase (short-subunit alcohol dehydrogenase family)